MTENTQPLWRVALIEILSSRILRILAIVFIGFEIYNTAVLPAVRGTQDAIISQNRIGQSKAEECSAKFKALMDTVPMNQVGLEVSKLREECRSLVSDQGNSQPASPGVQGTPLANILEPDKPKRSDYPKIGNLSADQRAAYREYLIARTEELQQSSDTDPAPEAIVARRVQAENRLRAQGIDPQTFDPH